MKICTSYISVIVYYEVLQGKKKKKPTPTIIWINSNLYRDLMA